MSVDDRSAPTHRRASARCAAWAHVVQSSSAPIRARPTAQTESASRRARSRTASRKPLQARPRSARQPGADGRTRQAPQTNAWESSQRPGFLERLRHAQIQRGRKELSVERRKAPKQASETALMAAFVHRRSHRQRSSAPRAAVMRFRHDRSAARRTERVSRDELDCIGRAVGRAAQLELEVASWRISGCRRVSSLGRAQI